MKISDLMDRLVLQPIDPEPDLAAGLYQVSLPWPDEALEPSWSLSGKPTSIHPLGCWPGSSNPRRLLLACEGEARTPEAIHPTQRNGTALPLPSCAPPSAEMKLWAQCDARHYAWEKHLLHLSYGSRSIGLMLGLKTGGTYHWWEACGLSVIAESPTCLTIEMAGSIPHHELTPEEFLHYQGYTNPYLHRHNWLSGHLYARLYHNGVVEIFAHHINNKFVDEGRDLADTVPVVGFLPDAGEPVADFPLGQWDGQRGAVSIGGIPFDLSEPARLATPQQPGSMSSQGPLLVWQPYQGAELYGGLCPNSLTGDPFIYQAQQALFPRGMARTLRFSCNLSGGSPRIVRYLAPAWWYGMCEEFLPAPLLPVSDPRDETLHQAAMWTEQAIVKGGFEDGAVPRGSSFSFQAHGRPRLEPGWEGEIPYAQFLNAWRTGRREAYECAMRSAYHFTDVAVDHASKLVRMHGYPPPAVALPMNRMQGTIAAYLETGDPYLLEIAEAVTANAHWQHKNSWPRMGVGRDACYLRSAVMLYRYFGTDFYRRIAHEGIHTVIASQRPNGSFGDQGGGAGIHQWSGYISKPWMGLLALNPVLDYLELFPEEAQMNEAVRGFADWLMQERITTNGQQHWAYQHDYRGEREYFNPLNGSVTHLPTPKIWHQETLARLMGYCTFRFQDPAYLEAWEESRQQASFEQGDHSTAAAFQFIPWIQARLWNASLTSTGTVLHPTKLHPLAPAQTTILTPEGPVCALGLVAPSSGNKKAAEGMIPLPL